MGLFIHEDELRANIAQILSIVEHIIVPVEHIDRIWSDEQIPQPIELPYAENYPDYDEFNDTVLIVLENRLQTTRNVIQTVSILSRICRRQFFPLEPEVRVVRTSLTFASVAKETKTVITIGDDDGNVEISVPMASTSRGHSITVCVFRTNPMWWYPAAFPIDSNVIFVANAESSSGIQQRTLGAKLEHTMPRSSASILHIVFRMPTVPETPTDATVAQSDSDMPVYAIRIPANGLLRVTFRLAAGVALRVHFRWNERPAYYEFKHACRVIQGNGGPANTVSIRWPNNHSTTRIVYLAIMAAESVKGDNYTKNVDNLIDFQFFTTVAACNSWSRNDWISLDCRLGEDRRTNDTHLHCICRQRRPGIDVTAYAAQLYVAPNQLHLPRDLQLALVDNWLVLGFVGGLLMVIVW